MYGVQSYELNCIVSRHGKCTYTWRTTTSSVASYVTGSYIMAVMRIIPRSFTPTHALHTEREAKRSPLPPPSNACLRKCLLASPAEEEPSAETSEEEAERVLAAVDTDLVAFASHKEGVPYYRLHRVVAKAITRRKFIVVSEIFNYRVRGRGDGVGFNNSSQYYRFLR